jgi:hypothetical protein
MRFFVKAIPFFMVSFVVLLFASCAGSPKMQETVPPDAAPPVPSAGAAPAVPAGLANVPDLPVREEAPVRVDYQGAAAGAEIPPWVRAAIDFDLDALQALPGFEDKIPMVDYGVGRDLELLRTQVNNFNMQDSIVRRIGNYVETLFSGDWLGDNDTAENRNFVEGVINGFSRIEIRGLAREEEYWIKLRFVDGDEQYYYYVLYALPEPALNEAVTRVINTLSAKTRDQEEILANVKEMMRRTAANSAGANS